jgi:hypothetical protein
MTADSSGVIMYDFDAEVLRSKSNSNVERAKILTVLSRVNDREKALFLASQTSNLWAYFN